jgi:hypothetical protein
MNYLTVEQTGPSVKRDVVPKMNPQIVLNSFNLGYNSVTFKDSNNGYTNFNNAYLTSQLPDCMGYQHQARNCTN